MDVADVARVVVSRDDDQVLALDPVEVRLRLRVLLLEAERRQVARADDDVRLELVDLHDRAVGEVRHEVRRAAVEIREVRDREQRVPRRRLYTNLRAGRPGSLLPFRRMRPESGDFQEYSGTVFANEAEVECASPRLLRHPVGVRAALVPARDGRGGTRRGGLHPDFFLPEQELYLEVTVMKQSLVTRKNRKIRKFGSGIQTSR